MTAEFAIHTTPVKSERSSSFKEVVNSAASRSKKAVSNLVKRAASSKSKKETNQKNPPSAKYEDLTIEELEAKILKLLPSEEFTSAHFGDETWDNFIKENGESWDKIAELQKILDKKILEKKTKETKKPSFFSRVSRVFRKEKKGGKTRKHKKTNKRRTYRRK